MTKSFLFGVAICTIGMLVACQHGTAKEEQTEPDRQTMLIGKWEVLKLERSDIRTGKEGIDTGEYFAPDFIEFQPYISANKGYYSGYYYEYDSLLEGVKSFQYGYTLHGDSIMLREETEYDDPWWCAWWTIDTLTQERLSLTSLDTGTAVLKLTLQRLCDEG